MVGRGSLGLRHKNPKQTFYAKNFPKEARETASHDKPKKTSGKWEMLWKHPDSLSGFSLVRAKKFRKHKQTSLVSETSAVTNETSLER